MRKLRSVRVEEVTTLKGTEDVKEIAYSSSTRLLTLYNRVTVFFPHTLKLEIDEDPQKKTVDDELSPKRRDAKGV